MSEGSVRKDYHDVKILAADERLLLAQALWVKVEGFLSSHAVGELGAWSCVHWSCCLVLVVACVGWRDGDRAVPLIIQYTTTSYHAIITSRPQRPRCPGSSGAAPRPAAAGGLATKGGRLPRGVSVRCRLLSYGGIGGGWIDMMLW